MAEDFPGIQVINRGFGGSQLDDSTSFAERIIFPYHPRIIVLYAGDNDLAAGKSPDAVVAEYTNFAGVVHERLPQTRIIFVSIKPSIARWNLKDKIIETNRRIAEIHADNLAFVDIYPHMLEDRRTTINPFSAWRPDQFQLFQPMGGVCANSESSA
jgi:hypothetical protein